MAACRICGAPHRACGASAAPVAQPLIRKKNVVGVKRYNTVVNGTETILVLSDEDAKRMGLSKPIEKKAAAKPANKSRARGKRAPANKAPAAPAAPATAPAAPTAPADGD